MVIKKSYEEREDGSFHCTNPNCDKFFFSLKAIHGHQRVHKTTATVPSSVTTEVNDDRRRGTLKRAVAAMAEGASLDFEEIEKVKLGLDELEAMDGLLMLLHEFDSHVRVCSSSPASDSKDPPIPADQEDRKTEEDNVSVDQQTVVVGVPKLEEELLGTPTAVGNNNKNNGESSGGSKEFKCNRCPKSYATSQALGGHVAGHNSIDRKAAAVAEGGKSDSEEVNREHKCEKCGVAFSSGQALGGHKRTHVGANHKVNAVNVDGRQTETTQSDTQKDTSSINATDITAIVDDDGAATGTVEKEIDEDVIMEDIQERSDDDCKRSGLKLDLNMEPIDLDDD